MTPLDLFSSPARQAGSLRRVAHRPWPPPSGGWLLAQTWEDLLFAHWPVAADAVRAYLPEELGVDTYDGSAWLGVTPFRVTGLRLRGTLPLPGVSSFLELNVRTYVVRDDRPGIWFLSLDASSPLAVEVARRLYRLPYFRARIDARSEAGRIAYECARTGERGKAFSARYGPRGKAARPRAGTLEHFLTERYCLYAGGDGGLHRADIHHGPWPLQGAVAEIGLNSMPPHGLVPATVEPLLHFSHRQDVVIWPLDPVEPS